MRTVGFITVGVSAVATVFAVVVGVQLIPDIRRYLKMRSM